MTLERTACPKCGLPDSKVIIRGKDYLYAVPGGFFVSECLGCSFWFQNPRPDPRSLALLYPSEYLPHQKPEAQSGTLKAGRRATYYLSHGLGYGHLAPQEAGHFSWLLSWASQWWTKWRMGVSLIPQYVEGGKLLEIGCGSGERLLSLRSLGWRRCHGIELIPSAAERARAAGFAVECGTVEDQISRFPRESFDVVIASMVLEHLYDPFRVVADIAARLRPGGEFLFSTVSRDSVEAMVYGPHWSGFDFPRHMVYFRLEDIEDMLRNHFERVERFHQSAPIDFLRSSSWRGEAGNLLDRLVIVLAGSLVGRVASVLLARLGLTSRVSFRCRRRIALRPAG